MLQDEVICRTALGPGGEMVVYVQTQPQVVTKPVPNQYSLITALSQRLNSSYQKHSLTMEVKKDTVRGRNPKHSWKSVKIRETFLLNKGKTMLCILPGLPHTKCLSLRISMSGLATLEARKQSLKPVTFLNSQQVREGWVSNSCISWMMAVLRSNTPRTTRWLRIRAWLSTSTVTAKDKRLPSP